MIGRKNKTKIFIDVGSYSIKVMVDSPSNIGYYPASILNDNSDSKNFIKDIKLSPNLSFNNELRAFWKGHVIQEERAIQVIKHIKQDLFRNNAIKTFEVYVSQGSFGNEFDKLKILKIFERAGLPITMLVSEGLVDSLGSYGKIRDGENTILVNLGFSKSSIYLLNGNNVLSKSKIQNGLHKIVKAFQNSIYDKLGLMISYEHAFDLITSNGNLIFRNEISYLLPARAKDSSIKEASIPGELIKEVLRLYVERVISQILKIKHQNSIEIYQSIMKNGICISGGLANISNLDIYIQKTLGIGVYRSESSYNSILKGLSNLLG